MAKHGLLSSDSYFDDTLTAAQIAALGNVGEKSRKEGEFFSLYFCLEHERQRALHNLQLHLDIETIRYPQFLDSCVEIFKKESNETSETYQMSSLKQKGEFGILIRGTQWNGGEV